MTFSDRLDLLLTEKKETRTHLAEIIGITNQSFSDWKKRGTIPSADIVLKIANYFSVSIDWLVTGKETDGLTHEDTDFIFKLRQLSEKDKNTVLGLIDLLHNQEELEKQKIQK